MCGCLVVHSDERIGEINERYLIMLRKLIAKVLGDGYEHLTPTVIFRLDYTHPFVPIVDKAGTGEYILALIDEERKVAATVAMWQLVEMPGCCGICISTGSMVYPRFRKVGIGKLLNLLRKELATVLGYGLLICTDVITNDPQQKILDQNGWKHISSFRNPRTQNVVAIHEVAL